MGEIIENITGQTLNDAISGLLDFQSLGLQHTSFEVYEQHLEESRIHQYYQGIDTYTYHPSLDIFGGGGLLSNCADLTRFFNALFNHEVYRDEAILDTMLASVPYSETTGMDYRMGISRIVVNDREAFTHTGFWCTQVAYFPEMNLSIATNYSQRWPKKGVAPLIPGILELLVSN